MLNNSQMHYVDDHTNHDSATTKFHSACKSVCIIIYNHYSNRRNNTTFRMWRMGYSKSLKPLKQSAREVIKMAFHLLKLRDQH